MYRKKGLVKMQGEKVTLQNIKGIGDKISEKILNSVGGEENLQKIGFCCFPLQKILKK